MEGGSAGVGGLPRLEALPGRGGQTQIRLTLTPSGLARRRRPRGRRRSPAALPHGAVVHDPPQPLRADQRHQQEYDGTVPQLHYRPESPSKHPSCGCGGRAAPALEAPTGVHVEARRRVQLRWRPAGSPRPVGAAGLRLVVRLADDRVPRVVAVPASPTHHINAINARRMARISQSQYITLNILDITVSTKQN